MQVKIFSAGKLHEALTLVREGMGSDAVILDRMQGVGADGETLWHVHAALDDESADIQTVDERVAEVTTREDQKTQHLEASMLRLERIVEGLGRQDSQSLRDAIDDKATCAAFDYLLQIGVSASFAFDLAEDYAKHQPIKASILNWATRIEPGNKPVVMLLAGPGGAGKTTLAAKLATHYSLKGVSIGLISTDADRMGGTDILKAYADILAVPFVTLRSQKDVPSALKKMQSAQLVLIDTEGWNPHRMASVRKQSAIWNKLGCTHKVLVMPANMDEEDGVELLAKAEVMGMSELALTKIDETSRPGKIVNWAAVSKMDLSYCSFGPDVPEQMGWLTPQALTTLLGSRESAPLSTPLKEVV